MLIRNAISVPSPFLDVHNINGWQRVQQTLQQLGKKRKEKITNGHAGGASFFFFICALWPDHTHLILDVVVA
jgi:hypothetical protein